MEPTISKKIDQYFSDKEKQKSFKVGDRVGVPYKNERNETKHWSGKISHISGYSAEVDLDGGKKKFVKVTDLIKI